MAPPQSVRVQGRTGANASRLNGDYKRRSDIGNRPAYVKTTGDDDKMVIWFWSAKKVWMMTRTSMINTDSAYACVQEDAGDPTKILKPWKVFDKKVRTHKADSQMKIIVLPESNTPRSPKARKAKRKEKPKEIEELQKEKKALQMKLDETRKQIDGMEEQMEKYEEELSRVEHEKYDAEQRVSFDEEQIFKITTNQHVMKEKLATLFNRFKKMQAELKANRESAPETHASFDQLLGLTDSPNFKSEVLLNCIFNVFEEQGLESSLQNIISPCTAICDEISSVQEQYS